MWRFAKNTTAKSLEKLAILAQWESAVGNRALAQIKAFMHAVIQKTWFEAKPILLSTTGIASSALDEPKAITQNECEMVLRGLGCPLAEVILHMQVQSAALLLPWATYSARSRSRYTKRLIAA